MGMSTVNSRYPTQTAFRFIIFWKRMLQSVMKLNELFLKIMIQKMDF